MEQRGNATSTRSQLPSTEELIRERLEQERVRLEQEMGIEPRQVEQFERPVERPFTRDQRPHTTVLYGGLTWKHERLIEGGLAGLGYLCEPMPVPDVAAFQLGKEYGNNGQCNPDVLHRWQPGQVPPGTRAWRALAPGDPRPVHLRDRRSVRALPVRHVRGRVPARAAQLGI